jgi:hypothetical protein
MKLSVRGRYEKCKQNFVMELESGCIENQDLSELYIMSNIESIPGTSLLSSRYQGALSSGGKVDGA